MTSKHPEKSKHPEGTQLSAYLDGMADVARTHEVAMHLRACATCRADLDGLAQVRALVRQSPAPSVPGPEFWAAAYRRLRVDDRERAQSRAWSWNSLGASWRVSQRRWTAGMAAAIALMGTALLAPHVGNPGGVHPTAVGLMTPVDDAPDVASLVRVHAASVASQPLADPDRQAMISYDAAFDGDSDDVASSNSAEAAGDADSAP